MRKWTASNIPAGVLLLVFCAFCLTAVLAPDIAYAVTYEYDDLNRLTRVVYDDGKTVTYTYDAAGNITSTETGDSSGKGGSGLGCSTVGPVPGEPVWPEVLWIVMLGAGFLLWRRKAAQE